MLTVLNLGGGVQSSTLALMLDRGELDPMPDLAIHADTQSDPPHVMAMVDWLAATVSYEVMVVTNGSVADDLALGRNTTGHSFISPPLHIRHADGTSGMGRRQCTDEYKVRPIDRAIRERLGLVKGARWPTHPVVTQVFGISVDEAIRVRDPRRPATLNAYPLVDARITRAQCAAWWTANAPDDAPALGRSACFVCPYQSSGEWRDLRAAHPDLFARAVDIDAAVRDTADDGAQFLHRSRLPLADAVDADDAQGDLFGGECDGLCGV